MWTPKNLALRTGVSVPTLHFYEKKGLIFSQRTSGNQRRYRGEMARRIAFIQAGQKAGISLAEIKLTLDLLPHNRTPTTKDWANISAVWTDNINARITQLEAMRDKFSSCIQCGCLSLQTCQIYNPNDEKSNEQQDFNQLKS